MRVVLVINMRSWLIQVSLRSLPYLQRTLIQKLVHRTTPPKFPDQKLWWSKDLRMRRPSRKIFAGVCYFAGQSSPKPLKKTLVCTLLNMKVALLFMPCSVKDSCRHADFSRNRTWMNQWSSNTAWKYRYSNRGSQGTEYERSSHDND